MEWRWRWPKGTRLLLQEVERNVSRICDLRDQHPVNDPRVVGSAEPLFSYFLGTELFV